MHISYSGEREDSVIRPMLNFTKQNLFEYAKQNNIELATEFFPDEKILRRLKSHSAEGDDIRLKYPPSFFGDKIKIDDTTNPATIIIKSQALANSILREENKE